MADNPFEKDKKRGPQGLMGTQGPKGPAGPRGVQGLMGAKGEGGRGPEGPDGPAGTRGPMGPLGSTGKQGSLGPKGATGEQGFTGDQGIQGPPGNDGVDGTDGKDGKQGKKGEEGKEGPGGLSGPRGNKGFAGSGVITGGTVGEVLTKLSSTDFDTEWATPAGSGDMLLAGVQTVTGAKTFNVNTLLLDGSTSGVVTFNAPAVAGTTTLTTPGASDTLVGRLSTDTLTNKTINTASNTITVVEADISDLGTTVALVADNLSVFAATTSAQLAGVISDETGSGLLVFGTSPTLVTPALGTPTALVGTNITGTAASLTAGTVSTITGLAPDTATTAAAQPNITSVGTLTTLQVDNVNINGNTISSTAGVDLLITPLAGQQLILDGTIIIDAGVVTGATSITSTSFVGALTGNSDTVTVADAGGDTTTFPLLGTAATGSLAPATDAGLTYNATTNALTTTTFVGALTGNADTVSTITGLAPDTATTAAAQPNITSLGTLTTLQVDNININLNTISSTAGVDLLITPLAGQQLILDGTIIIDAGVVTGATSITSTSFVGALTGNADTVTTNANLTGEVTSTGNAAVIDVTAISGQTLVTGATGDMILVEDATDGLLKRVDASDFLAGAGDMVLADVQTVTGAKTFNVNTLILDGSTSGNVTLNAPAVAGTTTLTTPGATDTLVGRLSTDTLTNKTINTASNTITVVEADISNLGTAAALVADNLSVFAATTSAQLAGVISDETGSGLLVFGTSPTLVTPALGTPSALVGTNITGTAASLTAGTVSTITGLAPDTATTAAAQPNITSLGTLTTLQVDNINVNGNTISSTAGVDLLITPLAGQQLVLDGTIVIDAGVVTGATSITPTAFVGALTGNADTVTTNANLTGEITSTGNAALLNVTAISGQATVTPVSGDMVLIEDATDGLLKQVDASNFLAGAGDMVLADVQTVTGAKTFGTIGGAVGKFILAGSTSGSTIVNAAAVAGTTTMTLPTTSDTLVGRATTDTLTNKTLTSPTLTTPVLGTPSSGNLGSCTAYPGDSSLVTTGTITSGTWQGTTIAVDQGGTGQTTYTNGQLLIGNTTGNTLAKATLTEGAGIDITNGTGTITIAGEAASVTNAGIVELLTTAEIDTGTDSTRAMPIDQYVASDRNIRFITIRIVEAATSVTATTSVGGDWVCPFTGTLVQSDSDLNFFSANTDTAGITGTMVVDVHKGGTTVMTTNKLDIETTEKSTNTATTQPDLTTTAVTAGDVFTFDVDTIHSGTAALGLSITMAIRLT